MNLRPDTLKLIVDHSLVLVIVDLPTPLALFLSLLNDIFDILEHRVKIATLLDFLLLDGHILAFLLLEQVDTFLSK